MMTFTIADLFDRLRVVTSQQSWAEVLRRDPCAYCGSVSDTIEHVIPRGMCGIGGPTNEVGACAACNNSRGSGGLLLFLVWRRSAIDVAFALWAQRKPPRQAQQSFREPLRVSLAAALSQALANRHR